MEIKRLEITKLEHQESSVEPTITTAQRMRNPSRTILPRINHPSPHSSKAKEKYNEDIHTILEKKKIRLQVPLNQQKVKRFLGLSGRKEADDKDLEPQIDELKVETA